MLARQGATVVAAARGDHARTVSDEIAAAGGRAEFVPLDVTAPSAIDEAVAGVVARHGRIDILVNNAGIASDQLMLRMKRDDWDAVLADQSDRGIRADAGGVEADDSSSAAAASSASARSSGRAATPVRRTTRRRRPA